MRSKVRGIDGISDYNMTNCKLLTQPKVELSHSSWGEKQGLKNATKRTNKEKSTIFVSLKSYGARGDYFTHPSTQNILHFVPCVAYMWQHEMQHDFELELVSQVLTINSVII
jgi:hypothetical protein